MRIAIIGAGAAGCFAAINLSRLLPEAGITVLEAGRVPLAKVAVTGGGRCNLTNNFEGISSIQDAYPRGANLMKRLLKEFGWKDTCKWFEKEGVRLTVQKDNCIFPKSQDAMEIVRALSGLMARGGVKVLTESKVLSISDNDGSFTISYSSKGSVKEATFDFVAVTTGGSPKLSGLSMLEPLGLEIIKPVPSLFTFNIPDQSLRSLSGIVVENTSASLSGLKAKASGPILITDWGMSGPAILKLSSYAARELSDRQYEMTINVNWMGSSSENDIREYLSMVSKENQKKQISSTHPEEISSRLWSHILSKAAIREDMKWAELGSKGLNRLCNTIICDSYMVKGRGKYKDEFVTCGGVSLTNVNPSTLESRNHPGLYFAGEVLDVDAITGGFNLQAAWTMGHIVSNAIAGKVNSI